MTLSRRSLLKRMPAVPFVAGAAISQAPSLLQRLGQLFERGKNMDYASLPAMSMPTAAEKLSWFANGLKWLDKPSLAMPESELVTAVNVRAVIQWEQYWMAVERMAANYEVPIEDARRMAIEVLGK